MESFIPNMLLNYFFSKDGLAHNLKRLLFVFYINSKKLLKLCMILFISKLKRYASFLTCSKKRFWKKIMNQQALNLHISNSRSSWKYFTLLGTMFLPFCEDLGWIFQKYDNNRQRNLIFLILTCADLVQSKKTLI